MKWNIVYDGNQLVAFFNAVDAAEVATIYTLEQLDGYEAATARVKELGLTLYLGVTIPDGSE